MRDAAVSAALRATSLGVSVATLYYKRKMPERDETLRRDIERVLREYPSYGHKRLAIHLGVNRKRVRRVMRLFGMHPYRRRGRRYRRVKPQQEHYPNLLQLITPTYEGCVWAADFTHLAYKGSDVSLATVIDLFSRRVVGAAVSTRHGAPLIISTFANALLTNGRPVIFHSDNGVEYHAKAFRSMLSNLGVLISRSKKGCPWENGYQESFYNQFKVDLGDPNRFASMGELIVAIYETIYCYNNQRIHSSLRMPPQKFAQLHRTATMSAPRLPL
jgi:putative transposase